MNKALELINNRITEINEYLKMIDDNKTPGKVITDNYLKCWSERTLLIKIKSELEKENITGEM